ncbi:hypothetical protein BDW68DRAFT_141027 [Aspergillus falconensis]
MVLTITAFGRLYILDRHFFFFYFVGSHSQHSRLKSINIRVTAAMLKTQARLSSLRNDCIDRNSGSSLPVGPGALICSDAI